ncbi:MAG: DNA polymerase III subunit gamma/tau [Betaproteobacteria bacterium]|nr:DNA polymerase III subunit gamma/tau [Betaproteobacteria bacterium]
MTQVLARKWRPRTFSEIVGQEHVVRALTNALKQQRLHHAYLFTGTRGVGKTTLARVIAKSLNCETGVTDTPCGKCGACMEIDAGRFVDLLELDAASNTQVDNMRELLENALYAPTTGRYKIYIIDEVHMLSRNAFNAMLKTLEEPPQHVKFILATTDPQKVPVTVLSRCLQFNLKQIPREQIRDQLAKILRLEGIESDAPALAQLARAARGSMRDALSLLDQAIAHGAGKVEEASVRAMLGAVDQDYLYAILRALAAGDGAAMVAQADAMAARSLSFEAALQELATLLHRAALLQSVGEAVVEEDPERAALDEVAQAFEPEEVQLLYQIALHGRNDIGLAPDEYAGFTMTLLRMLAFAPGDAQAGGRTQAARPVRARGDAAVPAAEAAEVKKNPAAAGWPELIAQLKLTGMAKMLAEHCELVAWEGARIELKVPETHRHLLEKAYQDRLKAALEQRLGNTVRLVFAVGNGSGNTPAEIADREKQTQQAGAIAAIEQDPFVRDLVENFDAKVIESTIKPVQ